MYVILINVVVRLLIFFFCIQGNKRTNIDDLVKAIEVRAEGEGPNTQEVRGGASRKGEGGGREGGRGGGSDSDGFQLST